MPSFLYDNESQRENFLNESHRVPGRWSAPSSSAASSSSAPAKRPRRRRPARHRRRRRTLPATLRGAECQVGPRARARKLAGGNPDARLRHVRRHARARRQGRAMRRLVSQKLQGEGGQGFEGTAGVPSFPALLPRHARARALANARRRACRAGVAGVPRAQPAVCRPACLRDLAPCGRRFEWILRLLLSPS